METSTQTATTIKMNLPRPVDFVGRKAELAKVLDALNPSTRAWVIALTGVGGIGKTELAIQVSYMAAESKLFDNIIWTTAKESWLTPEGIRPFVSQYALVSLNDLLDTAIEVLKLDPRFYRLTPERKAQHVNEALAASRCLLVVDNLETVQDPEIIRFLTNLPAPSKALVTSRLGGLSAQEVLIAQTSEGQREIRIGPLTEDDAITLFVQRAADHDFHFSRDRHLDKLQQIVDKAAYIPLAIEWIVGQMALKSRTLDDILNQLRSSRDEVLKYCFGSLVEVIGKKAEKVLLAVPIFVQPAIPEAILAITGMSRSSQDEVLRRLIAASLVELEADGRYSVLAPTRLYVSIMWRQVPDLYQEYCIRAARYYVQLLRSVEQHKRWKSIASEYHNVLFILTWCFENSHLELVLELARVASEYFQRLGLWDHRVHVCELATLAASNLGMKAEAITFAYDAAETHKHRGRLDEALEEFRRCEDYSRESGDKKQAAFARTQIGVTLFHKGENSEAVRALLQSLEMHRANDDKLGMAISLSLLGRVYLKLEDRGTAQKYFEDSLNLKREIGDQLGIAISLYDLGHFYHMRGDLQAAECSFGEALRMLSEIGDKRHEANAKWYYALLKIERGELDVARNLLAEILSVEESLHRDTRVERASARLAEVEKAIAMRARGATGESPASQPASDRRSILIVGIENYLYFPPVWSAGKDAQDLAAVLAESLGGHCEVVVLTGKEATCSAIRQRLTMLSVNAPGQMPIIVFVCHALHYAGRNYLCAFDTDPSSLEATAIEGMEFAALIRDITARDRALFLDCQHDIRSIQEGETPLLPQLFATGFSSEYLDYLARYGMAHVISSASEGQISHKFAHAENRLFAHFMLRGLKGEASLRGNNRVYLLDLYYFIERRVHANAQDQMPKLYPQPGDNKLLLCSVSTPSEAMYEATVSIADEDEQQSSEKRLGEIRELIIRSPIEGATILSGFLATRDAELQNQVDLYRSELMRIQSDKEKYGSVDTSLESQWQRRVFHLLDICHQLLQDRGK